jgi:hypothetical protein
MQAFTVARLPHTCRHTPPFHSPELHRGVSINPALLHRLVPFWASARGGSGYNATMPTHRVQQALSSEGTWLTPRT